MIKVFARGAEYDISAAIRREIIALFSDISAKNIVLIVPDQFEFETEKAIYKELNEKNLLLRLREIHVETFSSLSKKILAEAFDKRIYADETIKNILMHKAVREQKNALTSLSRQADKSGFCKKMLATVSMLKTAGLSANTLDENSIRKSAEKNEKIKNHLPIIEKLCDVSKIAASYESNMRKYLDKLDAIGEAAEILSSNKSRFFENADIFVDCFNDFTGSQLYFLMKLTEIAENITLGFTVELNENSREILFSGLQSQIDKIVGYANEIGEKTLIIEDNIPRRLPEKKPISELSENIFGEKKSEINTPETIKIIRAADVYEEIDYTAAKIKELCVDGGLLYREIAVLCADSSYGKYIKNALEKYEIPYFLDIPEQILYQPLVNFFLAVINALRDFSVDNVLSLVKTNFMSKPKIGSPDGTEDFFSSDMKRCSLSKKDIDDFENYIFEWNLQTKHLKKPFNYENNPSAERAEKIRFAVVDPILILRKKIKDKDGAEITRLIYEYAANDVGIERVLYNRCLKRNSGEIDTELLRVNQQVWDSLAKIFETLERELKGENISLDEYYRIFSDICAGTVLAKPPQFCDCVLVGDIDRTRAGGIRAAFILGASYEKFPTSAEGTGVFSENETEFLRENIDGLGISALNSGALKSVREKYCLSIYRAYKALTLPTERLEIAYPNFDEKGNETSRSQVIDDVLSVFPAVEIVNASALGERFYCRSIRAAKQRYAALLRVNTREKALLKSTLKKLDCGEFVDKLDEIRFLKSRKNADISDKIGNHVLKSKTAGQIFDRTLGATSAEKLNLCKFKYFCEFGLKIREKTRRIFNVGNRGNAVHYVLQKVLEKYCSNMSEFFKLSRSEFTSLALYYIEEFCRIETNGDFEDDKRAKFLFLNLANAATDVLITLQAEFAARDYRPKFFELNISDEGGMFVSENVENEQIVIPEAVLYTEKASAKNPENSPASAVSGDEILYVKPLEIRLDDGSEVKITGRVDRVDMFFSDNKSSYIRVVDYKFNAKSFDVENAKFGVNIQMLLYLFALCDANKNNKSPVLPGGISYIPSAASGAVEDKISAFRLLAMNHHQNGLYVRDENTDAEAEKYADFLINKIISEEENINNQLDEKTKSSIMKSILPEGENAPNTEEFNLLREQCIALLRQNLEDIFSGNVCALPVNYSEKNLGIDGKTQKKRKSPCDYCRFSLICGNNGDKVIDIDNILKGVNSDE